MTGFDYDPPAPSNAREFDDPYAETDVSTLPDWWREAIREFEEHGHPPYRPPRFGDGVLKHEVVDPLEAEFDVTIDFVGFDPRPGDRWTVRVDGEPIGTIGRGRSANRFTVFEMDSGEFERWIREALE